MSNIPERSSDSEVSGRKSNQTLLASHHRVVRSLDPVRTAPGKSASPRPSSPGFVSPNLKQYLSSLPQSSLGNASLLNSGPHREELNSVSEAASTKRKPCNCKHSRCLKLYCECFHAGVYCGIDCNCNDCNNNIDHEEVRKRSIEQTLNRDPNAFRPKIASSPRKGVTNGPVKHNRGCQCKKTGCLKRYCECFQAGVLCSDNCRCLDCKNANQPGKAFGILVHPTGSRIAEFSKTGRELGSSLLKSPGSITDRTPSVVSRGSSSRRPFMGMVTGALVEEMGELLYLVGRQAPTSDRSKTAATASPSDTGPGPNTVLLSQPDRTEAVVLKELGSLLQALVGKVGQSHPSQTMTSHGNSTFAFDGNSEGNRGNEDSHRDAKRARRK